MVDSWRGRKHEKNASEARNEKLPSGELECWHLSLRISPVGKQCTVFYPGVLEISGGILGCHTDEGAPQDTGSQGTRDTQCFIPHDGELSAQWSVIPPPILRSSQSKAGYFQVWFLDHRTSLT